MSWDIEYTATGIFGYFGALPDVFILHKLFLKAWCLRPVENCRREIKKSKMPGLQNNNNGSGSNQRSQNRGTRSSGKKWYRSKSGSNNQTTKVKANNQPKVRDLKFHLHGTDSSKKAEMFEKIKDNIVPKIKQTFVNAMDIAQSIQNGVRKS